MRLGIMIKMWHYNYGERFRLRENHCAGAIGVASNGELVPRGLQLFNFSGRQSRKISDLVSTWYSYSVKTQFYSTYSGTLAPQLLYGIIHNVVVSRLNYFLFF